MSDLPDLPVPLRFIPTLTEVVQPGSLGPAAGELPALALDLSGATDVMAAPPAPAGAGQDQQDQPDKQDQEARMVQRVRQRIDLVLEQRLQAVVSRLVLEHTQALLPRLHQEIELVVRESIAKAFEQEAPP